MTSDGSKNGRNGSPADHDRVERVLENDGYAFEGPNVFVTDSLEACRRTTRPPPS